MTCEARKLQLKATSCCHVSLCCAVAGRASQSTLPCPPVDSGSPTPPVSPAPRLTPGTAPGKDREQDKDKEPRFVHRLLLFIAHLKRLSRSFPCAVANSCVRFYWTAAVKVLFEPVCCRQDELCFAKRSQANRCCTQ